MVYKCIRDNHINHYCPVCLSLIATDKAVKTALQRAKQDIGYIIAFSFGRGAYEEVAEAKQRGLHMELLTVDKLLEYEEEDKQGKIL